VCVFICYNNRNDRNFRYMRLIHVLSLYDKRTLHNLGHYTVLQNFTDIPLRDRKIYTMECNKLNYLVSGTLHRRCDNSHWSMTIHSICYDLCFL